MQTLKIYQSLWAMELRSPDRDERSDEENFRMVAEAGYDGLCIDPSVAEIPRFEKLQPLYETHGLEAMVNAFPFELDDMQPLLGSPDRLTPRWSISLAASCRLKPEDAVPVARRWLDDGQAAGMPVLFETHRDSLLNDLYYTLQVMELVPEMRLCADLSHFVVDREMREPISDRDQGYIDRILDRADCFQGRIANREQVQIQIGFPQHQEWVGIFKYWWREGIRRWRARNDDDASLIFLCELGPPPYAITDGQRRELSDRWEER